MKLAKLDLVLETETSPAWSVPLLTWTAPQEEPSTTPAPIYFHHSSSETQPWVLAKTSLSMPLFVAGSGR